MRRSSQFPDYGIALFPTGSAGSVSVVGGEDLVIAKDGQNLAAAEKFAQFLESPFAQLAMAKAGQMWPLSTDGRSRGEGDAVLRGLRPAAEDREARPVTENYTKLDTDFSARTAGDPGRQGVGPGGSDQRGQPVRLADRELITALGQRAAPGQSGPWRRFAAFATARQGRDAVCPAPARPRVMYAAIHRLPDLPPVRHQLLQLAHLPRRHQSLRRLRQLHRGVPRPDRPHGDAQLVALHRHHRSRSRWRSACSRPRS